jgi:uncharacterized membrane protein YkoI
MDERLARKTHRWLGIATLAFFFISVITGLLWANARFLYWQEGYKERVNKMKAPPLEAASISLQQVFEQSRTVMGGDVRFDRVSLRADFGRLIYEVGIRAEGKARALLVDAKTGEILSPISESLAQTIARQYVRENAPITSVSIEQYTPRKKHTVQEAMRVRFEDRNGTEIILDRHTGEIIEDESRWRRFHFFIMQLHQLNFFGFEKTLLNFTGIPLLLLGLFGLWLWTKQVARKRRAERQGQGLPVPENERAVPE